ncbi:MAG: YgfZ/GcvT domain-containing protein, partial [Burkholderiales bacterium]
DFGDLPSQQRAAAPDIIVCDLSQSAVIQCSGDDAQKFLQAQLTNDVSNVSPSRSQYTAYCTPKGRMLASFLLWRSNDGYYLQLPASLADSIIERLRRYVLRAKVQFQNVSETYSRFGVAGNDAQALLRRVFTTVPNRAHAVSHGEEASLLCLSEDRFQVVAQAAHAPQLWNELQKVAKPAGPQVWDWLQIRAGIPVILPETQEQFVPQMVNFELIGGVSFEKGCYPGQEIVARAKYRGQIKRRMFLAHVASDPPPQPADEVYSDELQDQAAGMIVNSAANPEGGYDVLAVVQTSSVHADVRWKSREGPPLSFLPLPYALP